MHRSTIIVAAACLAGAALIAASRQPVRTEGPQRSALDAMTATEMSLVRRETATVGEFTSPTGPNGPVTIRASIIRATSDRLVTSKYAYGVHLAIHTQSMTLDVSQAQRLVETIDRIEAARAEQPTEPFEVATVTFKDASGLSFTAQTASGVSTVAVQLRDAGAVLDSLKPLRDLLAQAVERVNNLRKL
jgi:hypothetical protein